MLRSRSFNNEDPSDGKQLYDILNDVRLDIEKPGKKSLDEKTSMQTYLFDV